MSAAAGTRQTELEILYGPKEAPTGLEHTVHADCSERSDDAVGTVCEGRGGGPSGDAAGRSVAGRDDRGRFHHQHDRATWGARAVDDALGHHQSLPRPE